MMSKHSIDFKKLCFEMFTKAQVTALVKVKIVSLPGSASDQWRTGSHSTHREKQPKRRL